MKISLSKTLFAVTFQEGERMTRDHLEEYKRKFLEAVGRVNNFYFDTMHLSLPSVCLMWEFGRFMLSLRPQLTSKTTYVRAPERVKTFLSGFFRMFPPSTTILWTSVDKEFVEESLRPLN